mmetsp:Transcript_30245/g.55852  ORF Transcript_30245/g.55852 Transcript_30245/m.55852 type:complete len:326 (-) Transcript_30245:94-1071(-)
MNPMKRDASPAAASADGTPADRHVASTDTGITTEDATPSINATTPTRTAAILGEFTAAMIPKSAGSCKRRRLASEDDENIGEMTPPINVFGGSARKLNFERNNESDTSDDSEDEDPINQEMAQMRQESVLKKIQRLNYEDEDQLLHTAAFAKLFEYVKEYDVVAKTSNAVPHPRSKDDKSDSKAVEVAWKYRGSGYVKFIKCFEEGYNCGMIRAELTKNGTIETLMCHELTNEEVVPMPSKKGKAYTWRCKDWAYRTATRTFAIRFDDDMEALKWKTQFEQSKINNCRVRRGLDVPDISTMDDVCSTFQNLSTAVSSPSKASSGK